MKAKYSLLKGEGHCTWHKQLAVIFLIVFLILSSSYFVVQVHASEPSLIDIFNYLGFTNVSETNVETFSAGTYNITLYAEFAGYCDENELSYYEAGTSIFNVIFTGPEGGSGYISPPITKTFTADHQFGLSLLSHGYRYFSEASKNPNERQYAKVYKNLDDPNMFLIGFDERTYCDGTGDRDYNDMVFSLQLQYYLTVVSSYDTPSGDGWYYNGTNAFASLADGIVDHGNGTRRVFTHWSGDASGTNYAQSDPITMDASKTAIANWKTQYKITFNQSGVGFDFTGTVLTVDGDDYGVTDLLVSFWWDENSVHNFVFHSPLIVTPNAKQYLWASTSGLSTLQSDSVTVSISGNVTGNYKTQYYLTVQTDPAGLSPAPTPSSGWYDKGTDVVLTASDTSYLNSDEYSFEYWDVDGTSQGTGVNPITVPMNQPHTATAHYALVAPPPPPLSVSTSPATAKIKIGESLAFTSSVSGGEPPYSYQWYLNDSAVPDATSSSWTFLPESTGSYIIYLLVTDNLTNTAKSNEASVTVAPQLTVSISPMSASILVRQSIEFTPTVSGGYTPYSYQWYLGGNPVSGANSPSWTFTPTSEGIYYVYLKVTDANDNIVQSDTARITVGAVPVGGYSVSLTKPLAKVPLICYTILLAIFGVAMSLIRRKRK